MHKKASLFSLFLLLVLFCFHTEQCFSATNNPKVIVLNVSGAIGPATQDYINRGIAISEKEKAALIILRLDTPGGLESAMRNINEAILASPIPVVTYVAPHGARAASAGTFILYASHLAIMAPGTNVGAASPVMLGITSPDDKKMTYEQKKAVNDASAYLRSLAEMRGRNADFAEDAVRKSASITSEQAKKLKVIDDIANNIPDLLQKIDGRTVLVKGVAQKIQTQNKNFAIVTQPIDWRYELLSILTDPNVAYILMLIGIYGLFFEFANPGLILPGVVGIIALLLALYAFQLMPINYAGLTLLLVGITFMVFEVFISSFGILGFGGAIAFIIGSILLLDTDLPTYRIALSVIAVMSIATILFFTMMVNLAARSLQKNVITGHEGLIGTQGTVLSVHDDQILVQVLGEIWQAQAKEKLHAGETIKVVAVKGLTLTVAAVKKNQET